MNKNIRDLLASLPTKLSITTKSLVMVSMRLYFRFISFKLKQLILLTLAQAGGGLLVQIAQESIH